MNKFKLAYCHLTFKRQWRFSIETFRPLRNGRTIFADFGPLMFMYCSEDAPTVADRGVW